MPGVWVHVDETYSLEALERVGFRLPDRECRVTLVGVPLYHIILSVGDALAC